VLTVRFSLDPSGNRESKRSKEKTMETWEGIVLAAAIGAAVLLVVALVRIRQRRSHLRDRFGPEYQRAVADEGVGKAESRLSEIESTRESLTLRDLSPTTRDRYLDEWRQAESRFVSDPRDATRAAERLVVRVLHERGYPEEDEDPQHLVTLVSADHPDVADRYRHGHAMLESVDGAESTENLRKAMLDFRAVLEDVLHARTAA
jgi:hypothetical protein